MKWFNNKKIGTKLLISFGLVLLFGAGTCSYLVMSMKNIDKNYSALVDNKAYAAVYSLGAIGKYDQAAAGVRQYIIDGNPDDANEYRKDAADGDESVKKIAPLLETEEGKQLYKDFQDRTAEFKQYGEKVISLVGAREAARGADRAAAEKQLSDYLATENGVVSKMTDVGEALASRQESRLTTGSQEINAMSAKTIVVSIIAVILCILAGLGIAFIIARMISKPVSKLTEAAKKVALGDLSVDIEVDTKDEVGALANSFKTMTGTIKALLGETDGLIKAVQDGKLDTRGNAAAYAGSWGELVGGINKLVDAFVAPFNVVAEYIERIGKGNIPPKITDAYRGDFNEIKNNMNACIESVNGLVNESIGLAGAAVEGRLQARGDAGKFEGKFKEIVKGINDTLDAVINPINEAAECLQEMARGNLDVRMKGSYLGDHAIIKDAMNATLEALNEILKKEAIWCLQEMAKGNLDVEVTGAYQGDFARIKDALNTTINDLNEIIVQVSVAIEQVNVGAEQVSESSQSLSQGAAESASSMEQISASMHQINTQTKLNAENAVQANQLATQVRGNAEKGNGQMVQMVQAMGDINESASNISKIIKAIDEIAFQTNLLALNAAVEAARAGKHGKGFTVVAEEVRNLAQRSAKAAEETAEMIEGSIKKTEVGTRIAEETSKALEDIVLGVTKVTDFISEIASASREQSQGIDQINQGLGQVDQVTQQNSASSEELAAASEEMSSQSMNVRQMLGKFNLKQHAVGDITASDRLSGAVPQLLQKKMQKTAQSQAAPGRSRNPKEKASSIAAAASSASARVRPEEIISLDDVEYGSF